MRKFEEAFWASKAIEAEKSGYNGLHFDSDSLPSINPLIPLIRSTKHDIIKSSDLVHQRLNCPTLL